MIAKGVDPDKIPHSVALHFGLLLFCSCHILATLCINLLHPSFAIVTSFVAFVFSNLPNGFFLHHLVQFTFIG